MQLVTLLHAEFDTELVVNLYSRWIVQLVNASLPGARRVDIYYFLSVVQRPSQNRTCSFPTSGSSMDFTLRLIVYTDGALFVVSVVDISSNTHRIVPN
jgi:hypothetical protein